MLTPDQIRQFCEVGMVTVDAPFTEAELAAAATAVDRILPDEQIGESTWGTGDVPMRRGNQESCLDEELTALVQHPFLESCARAALSADAVAVYAMAASKSVPVPGGRPAFWEHVDLTYRLADLDARPRRMLCSCWVWLTDVTATRAPMMVRPGSHRLIAARREHDASVAENQQWARDLPPLPFAAPMPLLARRGQVSVLTTAAVHGASVNLDTHARKSIVVPFYPVGVPLSAHIRSELQRYAPYYRALRSRLRPERRHLVVDDPLQVVADARVPV